MRLAVVAIGLTLAGCASLKDATSPANLNADADIAYITVATSFPSRAVEAWAALQAERAAYVALTHVAIPTALDLQADAMRPASAPPPVFLLIPEAPLTQGQAMAKLKALSHG